MVWIGLIEFVDPSGVAGRRIAAFGLTVVILELPAHAVFFRELVANGVAGCESGPRSEHGAGTHEGQDQSEERARAATT
jgi:hypothetical protein